MVRFVHTILLFIALIFCCQAQESISGVVTESISGDPVPFANVYTPSGVGTYTEDDGSFTVKPSATDAFIVVSMLGYESDTVQIAAIADVNLVRVELELSSLSIETVEIQGEKQNLAKQAIKAVEENRKNIVNDDQAVELKTYRRSEYQRYHKPSKKDTIDTIPGWNIVCLYEELADHFKDGDKYKKIVTGELNSNEDGQLRRSSRFAIDSDFSGSNLSIEYNPIDVLLQPEQIFMDLYDDIWFNPNVTAKPIQSPIGRMALSTYNYRLDSLAVNEVGDSIFWIEVTPIFKQSAAYQGMLVVNAKQAILLESDLTLSSSTVPGIKSVTVSSEYAVDTFVRVTKASLGYEAKLSDDKYRCQHDVVFSDYVYGQVYPKRFFTSELVTYTTESLEHNAELWKERRPLEMNSNLVKFVMEQDSIYQYEHSPEYYRIQDSIYNHNSLIDYVFKGYGWKNRGKGITTSFDPAMGYFRLNHVGGWRVRIGGGVQKEFLDATRLDVSGFLNYGISNHDLKGLVTVGYTYLPKKFARYYATFGNFYDFITVSQSFDQILSPKNLIVVRRYKVGHAHELINGLYLDVAAQYQVKSPLNVLEIPTWTTELFGETNGPIDFDRYKALFIKTELIYKFGQKYIIRGPRKLLLSNPNPTAKLTTRVGVPNVFGSQVNFIKIQGEIYQRARPTFLGSTNYRAVAGAFMLKDRITPLEYQFFRGENFIFFSDPLENMQLLDENISTDGPYLMSVFVHHFDGFIMDKIPLLNLLQMEVITGAALLNLPESKYTQGEFYLGVGKKFKFFKETVQLSAYRVFAYDSNHRSKARYVFGANIYDPFNGQWVY